MKRLRTIPLAFVVTFCTGAMAAGSDSNLKFLAVQVSESAKKITKEAGAIKSADNPTLAQRDLNLRIFKLEETAQPLGGALDKPYGRCGEMVKSLHGFVSAVVGQQPAGKKFYFDTYRSNEQQCAEQISGDVNSSDDSDDDLVVLDL